MWQYDLVYTATVTYHKIYSHQYNYITLEIYFKKKTTD